jgi:hypothetical protein
MSKRRDERQKLLADTLDGDWSSGSPAKMAARAAAKARRRYTTHRYIGVVSSAAALLVIALLSRHFQSSEKNVPVGADIARTPPRAYTIISDQELMDSPAPLLILSDEHGGRKIVLVDR